MRILENVSPALQTAQLQTQVLDLQNSMKAMTGSMQLLMEHFGIGTEASELIVSKDEPVSDCDEAESLHPGDFNFDIVKVMEGVSEYLITLLFLFN